MVGAGLHSQLGRPADSPLVSWENLLTRAAGRLGLDDWRSRYDNYQLAWEELVLAATNEPQQSRWHRSSRSDRWPIQAAWVAEKAVRKVIGEVLDSYERQHPTQPSSEGCRLVLNAIDRLSKAGPLHILDFNFDCVLPKLLAVDLSSCVKKRPKVLSRDAGTRLSVVRGRDLESLYRRFPVPGGRAWLWKPHGHSVAHEGIRMGLRDYGLQPALLKYAFDQCKRAEKTWCAGRRLDQEKIRRRVIELDKCSGGRHCADTWVTRALTLDCIVIGLSVSQSEWGLHWLFAQRARNHARRGELPSAELFTELPSGLPLGVSRRSFSSWAAAWNGIGR
jgi:hypothetical protein